MESPHRVPTGVVSLEIDRRGRSFVRDSSDRTFRSSQNNSPQRQPALRRDGNMDAVPLPGDVLLEDMTDVARLRWSPTRFYVVGAGIRSPRWSPPRHARPREFAIDEEPCGGDSRRRSVGCNTPIGTLDGHGRSPERRDRVVKMAADDARPTAATSARRPEPTPAVAIPSEAPMHGESAVAQRHSQQATGPSASLPLTPDNSAAQAENSSNAVSIGDDRSTSPMRRLFRSSSPGDAGAVRLRARAEEESPELAGHRWSVGSEGRDPDTGDSSNAFHYSQAAVVVDDGSKPPSPSGAFPTAGTRPQRPTTPAQSTTPQREVDWKEGHQGKSASSPARGEEALRSVPSSSGREATPPTPPPSPPQAVAQKGIAVAPHSPPREDTFNRGDAAPPMQVIHASDDSTQSTTPVHRQQEERDGGSVDARDSGPPPAPPAVQNYSVEAAASRPSTPPRAVPQSELVERLAPKGPVEDAAGGTTMPPSDPLHLSPPHLQSSTAHPSRSGSLQDDDGHAHVPPNTTAANAPKRSALVYLSSSGGNLSVPLDLTDALAKYKAACVSFVALLRGPQSCRCRLEGGHDVDDLRLRLSVALSCSRALQQLSTALRHDESGASFVLEEGRDVISEATFDQLVQVQEEEVALISSELQTQQHVLRGRRLAEDTLRDSLANDPDGGQVHGDIRTLVSSMQHSAEDLTEHLRRDVHEGSQRELALRVWLAAAHRAAKGSDANPPIAGGHFDRKRLQQQLGPLGERLARLCAQRGTSLCNSAFFRPILSQDHITTAAAGLPSLSTEHGAGSATPVVAAMAALTKALDKLKRTLSDPLTPLLLSHMEMRGDGHHGAFATMLKSAFEAGSAPIAQVLVGSAEAEAFAPIVAMAAAALSSKPRGYLDEATKATFKPRTLCEEMTIVLASDLALSGQSVSMLTDELFGILTTQRTFQASLEGLVQARGASNNTSSAVERAFHVLDATNRIAEGGIAENSAYVKQRRAVFETLVRELAFLRRLEQVPLYFPPEYVLGRCGLAGGSDASVPKAVLTRVQGVRGLARANSQVAQSCLLILGNSLLQVPHRDKSAAERQADAAANQLKIPAFMHALRSLSSAQEELSTALLRAKRFLVGQSSKATPAAAAASEGQDVTSDSRGGPSAVTLQSTVALFGPGTAPVPRLQADLFRRNIRFLMDPGVMVFRRVGARPTAPADKSGAEGGTAPLQWDLQRYTLSLVEASLDRLLLVPQLTALPTVAVPFDVLEMITKGAAVVVDADGGTMQTMRLHLDAKGMAQLRQRCASATAATLQSSPEANLLETSGKSNRLDVLFPNMATFQQWADVFQLLLAHKHLLGPGLKPYIMGGDGDGSNE